jgi:hypothetical protein
MSTLQSPITVHLMTTPSAFAAIEDGDLDALTEALDAGTDPNAMDVNGLTLLMHAVYQNRLHMVDVLLSRGANVYLKTNGCITRQVLMTTDDAFAAIGSRGN